MPEVADVATCPDSVVYQLRVVLAGISPLIWRRLLVPATATIAQLHTVVQTVFGWGGEHLHRFVIHGVEYGICYVGGPSFRDHAGKVRLGELGLRITERFAYEYNFTVGWRLDLRLEQIRHREPARGYPHCTGGRRAGPPEGWAGPLDYLERTQLYLVFDATLRAAGIVGPQLSLRPCRENSSLARTGHLTLN